MKSAKLQPEEDNSQNRAYEYAVFLLGIKLRTEGELREKLKNKSAQGAAPASGGKYNAEAIDFVINRLKDQHYIDDQRFAEVYLENLKKYKSWGYYGVKKKLMEKKLPASIIERVLSEGLSEEEELKIAARLLKNSESGIRNYEAKQKTARKLAAKGFRSGVIAKITFDSQDLFE